MTLPAEGVLPLKVVPESPRAGRRLVLAAIFFLSGISGLIYQVCWQRALTWVFGVHVYATTTAVACFLIGLCVGSWFIGSRVDRMRRPGLTYAWMEAVIALTGAASLFLFGLLPGIETSWLGASGGGDGLRLLVRVVLCLGVMIVPTALMGATLPLLARAGGVDSDSTGGGTGLLYGANTVGAVFGCFFAGFWSIPSLGIAGTVNVAAAGNLLAALAAGLLFRRRGDQVQSLTRSSSPGESALSPAARRLLLLYGLSGFASLGLEMVWMRQFLLVTGYSSYAFSMVLGVYLAGVGAGSLLFGRLWDRARDRLAWLAGVEATMAVLVAAGAFAYPPLCALVGAEEGGFWARALQRLLIVSAIIGLPTFLLGAMFPLVARCVVDAGAGVGRALGAVNAANLVGSVLGTGITGFLLFATVGMWGAEAALAGVYALCALLAATLSASGQTRAFAAVGAVACGVCSLAPRQPVAQVVAEKFGESIRFVEEGPDGVVTVGVRGDGRHVLRITGMEEGLDLDFSNPVQGMFAHLPALLHRDPRSAMIVGLGSGNTVIAFLVHPGLEVRTVELCREIVDGARAMVTPETDYFASPRFRLHTGDARHDLLRRDETYDIIVSGSILADRHMAGNLYSHEYWSLCRTRLRPGGLMCQWVRGISPTQKILLRTFLDVFPGATAWNLDGHHTLLLGSVEPLRIDHAELARRLGSPERAPFLGQARLREPLDIYRRFLAGPETLSTLAGVGPRNTDDRPLAEFYLHSRETDRLPLAELMRETHPEVLDRVDGLNDGEGEALRKALSAPR